MHDFFLPTVAPALATVLQNRLFGHPFIQVNISGSLLRSTSRYIAPIILFLGGIWILSIRIPFWSLFLGIVIISLGLSFTIFSFDRSASRNIGLEQLHIVKCEVCGDPTAVPKEDIKGICPLCRTDKYKSIYHRPR